LADGARPGEGAETEGQKWRETSNADKNADEDDSDPDPCWDHEAPPKHAFAGFAPRERGRHGHKEQQCQADRNRQGVEVWPSDSDLLPIQRLDKKREDRTEEHDECEPGKKKVVDQKGAFT
jgi:hypothetical protein